MRTVTGIAIGITVNILAYALWKPAIRWAFNHDQPVTPEGWAPRHRQWQYGVEIT